jgi:hypothetical protein
MFDLDTLLRITLAIGAFTGWVGFLGYAWEVHQGRVGMWTLWKDLTPLQYAYVRAIFGGVACLVLSVVGLVLLR